MTESRWKRWINCNQINRAHDTCTQLIYSILCRCGRKRDDSFSLPITNQSLNRNNYNISNTISLMLRMHTIKCCTWISKTLQACAASFEDLERQSCSHIGLEDDAARTARIRSHHMKIAGILIGAKIVYVNLIQLTLHSKTLAYFTFAFVIKLVYFK